jgi:hypothetical protein
VFTPRREHARFCSVRCRVTCNREKIGDPAAGATALQWSITAMSDATRRLARVRAWDQERGSAVIAEAVWWVTIVDATLVRHHLDTYDRVLAGHPEAEQALIEETLAGLRFVRNRMGHDADHVDIIKPAASRPGRGADRITAWTWQPVPEPAPGSLSPRGQAWEMTRHRAYQAQLAGHTIGETFGRAAAFLSLTATNTAAITKVSAHAAS